MGRSHRKYHADKINLHKSHETGTTYSCCNAWYSPIFDGIVPEIILFLKILLKTRKPAMHIYKCNSYKHVERQKYSTV